MVIPDDIAAPIALQDQYFDLKGLSAYASMGVSTLRDSIKARGLPCFKLGGKVLVRRSEFDTWVEKFRVNKARNLSQLADDIMADLST